MFFPEKSKRRRRRSLGTPPGTIKPIKKQITASKATPIAKPKALQPPPPNQKKIAPIVKNTKLRHKPSMSMSFSLNNRLQGQIQARQIQAQQIQARQIQAQQIQARQIQARQIQAQQIQARQIQAQRIQAQQIYLNKRHHLPASHQQIIPLNLFQTWYTLDLPREMKKNVEQLKIDNPEFKHHLYDDKMCRRFIKRHFDDDVVFAFDKLKPGAFKADLWRYCVLYIHGGIYLDIKMKCVNHFNLMQLTDKEYWVKDRVATDKQGIWQGLIASKAKNKILRQGIDRVVQNVKNNSIDHPLKITGPLMINSFFDVKTKFPLKFGTSRGLSMISLDNYPIMKSYKEYRSEYGRPSYNLLHSTCDVYHYPVLKSNNTFDLSRTLQREGQTFYTGTPTILQCKEGFVVNQRWVNYKYNKNGAKNNIPKQWISLNSRYYLDSEFKKISEEVFFRQPKDSRPGIGLEDIRLYHHNGTNYFIANRMAQINHGVYPLDKDTIRSSEIKTSKPEKNWSYVEFKRKLCVVYQWFPLKIGEIQNNKLRIIYTDHDMPDMFQYAKGGTPGIKIGDEIWFVLHRSYNNRTVYHNYQHFFAVFDLNMRLLRYSELFKFTGEKIEYCTGIIHANRQLFLSYSTLDCHSFISIYDIDNLSVLFYDAPKVDIVCGWIKEMGITRKNGVEINKRDNGELKYCLRSIHKYCPQINNIYIILGADCDPPSFLKETNKLHFIKESDLYKNIQPNSETKKIFYGQIKGLSEYFLSFDDDFFLCKPLRLNELISYNKPFINSTGFFGRYCNDGQGHLPIMWKRDDYNNIIDKYVDKEFYLSLGTHRTNPFQEIKHQLVEHRLAYEGPCSKADFWFHGGTLENALKKLKNMQGSAQYTCLNEHLSRDSSTYQKELVYMHAKLDKIYPTKGDWEK